MAGDYRDYPCPVCGNSMSRNEMNFWDHAVECGLDVYVGKKAEFMCACGCFHTLGDNESLAEAFTAHLEVCQFDFKKLAVRKQLESF